MGFPFHATVAAVDRSSPRSASQVGEPHGNLQDHDQEHDHDNQGEGKRRRGDHDIVPHYAKTKVLTHHYPNRTHNIFHGPRLIARHDAN